MRARWLVGYPILALILGAAAMLFLPKREPEFLVLGNPAANKVGLNGVRTGEADGRVVNPNLAPFVPPVGTSGVTAAPSAAPFVPPIVNPGAVPGSAPNFVSVVPPVGQPGASPGSAPNLASVVPPVGQPGASPGAAPNFTPVVPPVGMATPGPIRVPTLPVPVPAVPDNSRERIQAAVAAYQSGDRETARTQLAGVDLSRAASAPAWEVAGLLKEFEGDKRSAEDCYSRGLVLAPSAGIYYRRALLRRGDEDFPRALEDLDRAVALSPENIVFTNDRLLLLIQMGSKDRAGAEMKALSDRGGSAGGWIFGFCGMALENGDYRKAASLLARAKKSVPPHVFAQMLMNPVIARHQSRPEILPFFFTNLNP